jgi:uncharacterized protein YkwD
MRFITILLLCLALGCNQPKPTPPTEPTPPVVVVPPTLHDVAVALVTQHNEARASRSLAPLKPHTKLMSAAQEHAEWMAKNKKMSHVGAGGSSVSQRIVAEEYYYRNCGENIAYGYRSVASVMNGWLNSKGHRDNILGSSYVDLGIGLAADEHGVLYWCVVFGRPDSAGKLDSTLPDEFIPPAIYADAQEITDSTGISIK